MALSNDGDGDFQASSRSRPFGYVELSGSDPSAASETRARLHISKKSTFRERDGSLRGDDHMVEDPYIDQRQGVPQTLGDAQVRLAGLGHARGVVVSQDDSAGPALQGAAHHLTRVHARPVDGALEQLLQGNDPMPGIQLC